MSSTSQVKTVLGERAFDYLRICLDAGQSLIEEQASLPLESGCLWSCLPADFTGAQRADPRWSLQGVITDDESKGKADILLAEFILHYLQDGQSRYAIFQDWKATPNTGVPVGWLDHYFTFGSEVYHIIQSTDAALNMESILNVMHRGYLANPRLNVGILTTANDLSAIMPGQEITPDMMRTLSQGVEHIIVDGFDGDREIIWSKRVIVDK
jgi:hypothetical protein